MNRKETTAFLSDLLISERLSGAGKHWSREVSIDWGTSRERRVDFMLFEPKQGYFASGIEKGTFTCFEVKSCREDIYSGNGLNFLGEKNYIVTTMECYKNALIKDMQHGAKFWEYLTENFPESSHHIGVMVACPYGVSVEDEFENPTPLDYTRAWHLPVIIPCREGGRRRGMVEMLFFMLRSGK